MFRYRVNFFGEYCHDFTPIDLRVMIGLKLDGLLGKKL